MITARQEPGFEQRQADQVARLFNLAFTNTSVYGGKHPATLKSVTDLQSVIEKNLELLPMLTFMIEREFFYLEQWRVDTKFSATKLINIFKKVGLQSITLERSMKIESLQALLYILSQNQYYSSVNLMTDELQRINAIGVRFNYVTYQKITADEAVIDKSQDLNIDMSVIEEVKIKQQVLKEFSRIVSMRDLMQNPSRIATSIISSGQATSAANEPEGRFAVEQLREIRRQVRSSEGETAPLSAEEMLEAVYRLKSELLEGIRVQRSMGQLLQNESAVLSEVDRLTYDVIVRMAREEYRSGARSLKRLAQVIRKMLPTPDDLRKMLPLLKEGLIADGMSLTDFLALLQELQSELSGGGIIDALREGAESLGLSADELANGIKENPHEAAKLIVLASEIRNGSLVDQFQLSKVLGDYVEQVSTRMALESTDPAAGGRKQSLDKVVSRIERQLVDKLKAHGIADDVIKEVDSQLASRFQKTLDQLKSDWLMRLVASGKDVSEANLLRLLDSIVDQEIDLGLIQDQLRTLLAQQGYDPTRIDRFFEQLRTRLLIPKEEPPQNILSANNTLFFLKHHLGMCKRYLNPFSTLLITINALCVQNPDNVEPRRAPTPQDSLQLMPQLIPLVARRLRDLDMLGALGNAEYSVPFIILPMTSEEGATVVKDRIDKSIGETSFLLNGLPCLPEITVSLTFCDAAHAADMQTFITYVKQRHQQTAIAQQNVSRGNTATSS